jgi:hypothetical protein
LVIATPFLLTKRGEKSEQGRILGYNKKQKFNDEYKSSNVDAKDLPCYRKKIKFLKSKSRLFLEKRA